MSNVIIPISIVLEFDDLGWDNGRDLRLVGKASRSGLPRNHAMEDYEVIQRIIDKTGKGMAAALCVGDWDKDNILRGEVGFTHNPHGWDRAAEMDVELCPAPKASCLLSRITVNPERPPGFRSMSKPSRRPVKSL